VDASNTGPDGGVLLLPEDPDAAAADLHARLVQLRPGAQVGVLLTDTAGRAWRAGQVDLALGAHGLHVVDDLRGGTDVDGRPLAVTERALADELAAAADLVKGKLGEVAAALVRGLPEAVAPPGTTPGARTLVRTGPSDWFALGHREAVRAALGAPPGSTAAEEVGLASVAPEPEEERGARAVRLALLGQPGGRVTGSAGLGYAVHATDPVTAGRVAARLEVALAGEDVQAQVRVAATPPAPVGEDHPSG
jgi:coenzyme F420-0:L-glutamate ligase/coenzyme F420-1:gamma-L-glutamate ligase